MRSIIAMTKRLNWLHVLADSFLIAFSLYASAFLRLGTDQFGQYFLVFTEHLPIFVFIRVITFVVMGIYDIMWRYVSVSDSLKIARAVLLSSVLIVAATYFMDLAYLPRSVFFIDTALLLVLVAATRIGRRMLFEYSSRKMVRENGRLTLIYGVGPSSRATANRILVDSGTRMKLVGFVSQEPEMVGRVIEGVKILGTREDLSHLLRAYAIQELVIATSSPLSGEELRSIVQVARQSGIRPRLAQDRSGKDTLRSGFGKFREIDLEDLLSRPKRTIELGPIEELIRGKRVLITGAGGSIGSELARQVRSFGPSRLLLLDHSEFNLYQIDQELRVRPGDTSEIVPLMMDIKDKKSLEQMFREYMPEIVFHAAAYKHVHLVEGNPCVSILNNVLGTRNLVELAEEARCEAFVLISTDKAVNPVGVMGASKRACELVVAQAGERTGRRFCAVRFGNVLGSSGSLIPLLQKQLQNEEPVTITHQDMTRYFMLIPEAVSLVLRASTIAQPGDIAVLRMGEPVKIVDVAKSLIALSGKSEDEVSIVFTGLRPGEKMFEELYLCGNEVKTEDPDILIIPKGDARGAASGIGKSATLVEAVERIIRLAREGELEAIRELRSLIQHAPTPGDAVASSGATASDPHGVIVPLLRN